MTMIANLPVIEIAADRSGLEHFMARQRRRQRLLILRKHIPWSVRKHSPHEVSALVEHFQMLYGQMAKNYMQVTHVN